ncbi:MAG: FliA/WhiG family RNA polymerase sigma factor [Armatimonadota bacterium]
MFQTAESDELSAVEREQLITDNVDLVRYEVDRVAGGLPEQVDREDLVSAGMIGLIKAVDRYDPGRGASFRTYASTLMRGAILDELRRMDWAPRGLRGRYRELEATVAQLRQHLGRQPDEAEIIEQLGISSAEYRKLLQDASTTALVSLESLTDASGDAHAPTNASLRDGRSEWVPHAVADRAELRRLLVECIRELSEREQMVISLYYQEELTMREIGMVLDVTESRICQIHTQATTRLRAALNTRLHS